MTTEERRKLLVQLMKETDTPLSGSALGEITGVSRQVIVQDIAVLRSAGEDVIATARGYYIEQKAPKCMRLVKVHHTDDDIEDELNTIVDLGGAVIDVIVNHKTYGKISGSLNIKSRRDVAAFLEALKSGKSTPLAGVTSGYHFHNICAESDEILDEIQEALKAKNYLAELLPYEVNI